jgi:hypothetical protein
MLGFRQMIESHMFHLPPEANAIVPKLKSELKELSATNFKGSKLLATLPDPFSNKEIHIWANDSQTFDKMVKKTGHGAFGVAGGQPTIVYRVPMTDYDTVYHELVHAHDPQHRKGISKSINNNIGQSMTTPHEILAYFSGKIEDAVDRLKAMPLAQRIAKIQELTNWLRKVKDESDLEPYNVPSIFQGLGGLSYLSQDKRLWRQFTSRVWNDIINYQNP